MSRPELIVVSSEQLAQRAAEWFAQALREALAGGGRCSFALSGGLTPRPIYRTLAGMDVPWDRVDFYFVDERCVPPDHQESNYFHAEANLFGPAGVKPEQVHRMEGERDDREAAARDYEALLPRALDVALIGMGEDGHTASLFPGASALEERQRHVLAVVGPKPPPWRLTLTLPVLLGTRKVLNVVAGEGKRDAARRALTGEALPITRVTNAVWMMDEAAAGQRG